MRAISPAFSPRSASSLPRLVRSFALPALLAAAGGDAAAQVVDLSGSVFDGTGGPLRRGVVYRAVAPLVVPVGATLTVEQGSILKFDVGGYGGHDLTVEGTLVVNGAPGEPAIFTSIQDDSAGGDTNQNGPSVGAPGQWQKVRFLGTSDASSLRHLEVRFAGGVGWGGIEIEGSDVDLADCLIRDCSGAALDLNGTRSFPQVTGCEFRDNRGVAVDAVHIDTMPYFSGNRASGNARGNYLQVTNADPTGDVRIAPANVLGGALVFADHCDVPPGATLALEAGVVVKIKQDLYAQGLTVEGMLRTSGTAAQPVVFTSLADDAYGGDTNGDGPSTGRAGEWGGIRFGIASDRSLLVGMLVRYGGASGTSAVYLSGSDLTMRDCTIERCSGRAALELSVATPSRPTVTGCSFVDNLPVAVGGLGIDAVPGFVNNTAARNAGGDYMRVDQADPIQHAVIGPSNLVNGALVMADHCDVPLGVTLTFKPGTVVKVAPSTYGAGFTVQGSLRVLGTGYEPVVFTSLADDAWAGDTNGDGPSTGAPGQWAGFYFPPNAGHCVMEYARLCFGAGGGYFTGVYSDSPLLQLRSVRMEHMAGWYGFRLAALDGWAENLVAWKCRGDGVWLTGGSFPLVQSTIVACGAAGIRKDPNWRGIVSGCISWTNAENFVGFQRGNVYSSNGDRTLAGHDGNTFVIPGFIDEAGGDFHLDPYSYLIDLANVGYSEVLARDAEENSRLLDNDVNSVAKPDMGAYEVAYWDMTVAGKPRIGESLTFTVQSNPGISFYFAGALDGRFNFQPFGMVNAGLTPFVFTTVFVGTPVSVWIPDDPGLVGLELGIQTLTFPLSTFLFGSVTRLYRLNVRA
jgi:hypothetical protein